MVVKGWIALHVLFGNEMLTLSSMCLPDCFLTARFCFPLPMDRALLYPPEWALMHAIFAADTIERAIASTRRRIIRRERRLRRGSHKFLSRQRFGLRTRLLRTKLLCLQLRADYVRFIRDLLWSATIRSGSGGGGGILVTAPVHHRRSSQCATN